jgi:hypothetical protein
MCECKKWEKKLIEKAPNPTYEHLDSQMKILCASLVT